MAGQTHIRPDMTMFRKMQGLGNDFAVFDALLGVGLKRRAKPGRLQLAVYVTLRKVPLESGQGDTEAAYRAARTRPVRAVT